ncbi:MAG: 2'-5' RNA ligase family protein [Pseudomonadota bacterium]
MALRYWQLCRIWGTQAAAVGDEAAVELFSMACHSPSVIYVLGYPDFEPLLAERITAFREKHEPQRAKLVPPHLTLVFGVKEEHLQAVAKRVEDVSRQTQIFSIAFDATTIDFDPFEQKYKIFLLCGKGRKQISALHNQLYEADYRRELVSSQPFRPHMTIATYDKNEDIMRVDVSEAGSLPIYGRLRGLALVRFADGKLETLKTVPFFG